LNQAADCTLLIAAAGPAPTILKPSRKLRVTLSDPKRQVRCQAVVACAAFEVPPGTDSRCRAGIEFLDANALAADASRFRGESRQHGDRRSAR
jgi:hypothetical protein